MLQLPSVSTRAKVNEYREAAKHSAELIRSTDKLTSHVYANINVKNNTTQTIRAEYSTTQDLPILSDQQDYQVKISRLKIPMAEVPLFEFKDNAYFIAIGQREELPGFELTNQFGYIQGPVAVEYIPQIAPTNPIILEGSPYTRAVMNVQDFLDMVNQTLLIVWQDFLDTPNAPTGWPKDPYENLPPKFTYDCDDNCIKFEQPYQSANTDYPVVFTESLCATGDNRHQLLMSEELWTFFNGFQYFWYGPPGVINLTTNTTYNNLNNGLIFQQPDSESDIITKPDFGACLSQEYWVSPQTVSSIYAWQRVSRISITTTLPLVKESVLLSSEESGNPLRFEVLTDFEIPQANNLNHNEYIYYYGDDSDRYYNIKDSGPLYKVEVGAFIVWQDGNVTPLYISPGHAFYLKLHFERRLNNNQFQITDTNSASQSGF